MTTVAVCALTFRRPHGLDALLASLAALDHPGGACDVKVVIVDNDPDGSAEPVVDRWRHEFPWELVYVVEGASRDPVRPQYGDSCRRGGGLHCVPR